MGFEDDLLRELKNMKPKDRYNERIAQKVNKFSSQTIRYLQRLVTNKELKPRSIKVDGKYRKVYYLKNEKMGGYKVKKTIKRGVNND